MKKQVLSSAILTALSVGAQAALPTIDPATTTTVYIAGSSSERGYIQQTFVGAGSVGAANRLCDNASEIWQFNDVSGASYNAWYCTKASANTGLIPAKAHLLVHKRSAGGSDLGVAPIISNVPIGFLDLNTCTQTVAAVAGTTVGQATCTGTTLNAVPDLGVSDVDPAQFVGLNVLDPPFVGVRSTDLTKLTIKSTATVVFGVPVSLKLYNALQAAQLSTGEIPATTVALIASTGVTVGQTVTCTVGDRINEGCMPSLKSAYIHSIHAGLINDWNLIPVGTTGMGLYDWTVVNSAANAPAINAVHIVRRVNGSGAQAQHGIYFFNYPCINANPLPVNNTGQTEPDYVVHEMSTAGDVNTALNALNTGTAAGVFGADSATWANGARWAVGLQSLENKGTNFEFVKIDCHAPTLANVVAGKYDDWMENTFQYNNTHYAAVGADVKAVINTIVTKTALPAVLSSLNALLTHGFGNGAYLALPSVATAPTLYDPTNPINRWTRTPLGASINNCNLPTLWP